MRKLFILLTIFTAVLSSCAYDYDIDENLDGGFTPKVVLNSVITPDSLIKGSLVWTRYVDIDDRSDFETVDAFDVKLYEDEHLIFDDQGTNGEFETNIYPKAGSSYRIELYVPQYGEVKASTNIPRSSTFIGSHDEDRTAGDWYSSVYRHYTIDNVVTSQKSRALWIRYIMGKRSDGTYFNANIDANRGIFLNNPFCDQINTYSDPYDVALKGSEMGHMYFIRIPYKNISQTLPLKFSVATSDFSDNWYNPIIGEDDWGYPIYGEPVLYPSVTNVVLMLITPSDDYDKYYKSVFRQGYFAGDIFSEAVNVYSNVENGVGIFAGYVTEKQYIPVERKQETVE